MKTLTRLKRYIYHIPRVCPFCLMNPSLGFTSYGIIGCRFCQANVDKWVSDNFVVNQEDS